MSIFARKLSVERGQALRTAIDVTSAIREVGDILFIPPLSASAAIVLQLLRLMQTADNNQDLLAPLGKRASAVLLLVKDNFSARTNDESEGVLDAISPKLSDSLSLLENTLNAILGFVASASKVKWINRFIQQTNVRTRIDRYTRLLELAERDFYGATLFDIHRSATLSLHYNRAVFKEIDAIRQRFDKQTRSLTSSSPSPGKEDDIRLLYPRDLVIQEENNIEHGWWSNSNEAEVDGGTRLVKWYTGSSAQTDLESLKRTTRRRHAMLPQLFGRSHPSQATPFIVLSHSGCRDIKSQVLSIFRTVGVVPACQLVAELAYEISSVVRFLRDNAIIRRPRDVLDFLDVSNMILDGNGHLVLGGLLHSADASITGLSNENDYTNNWAFSNEMRAVFNALFGIDDRSSNPAPQNDEERKRRLAERLMYAIASASHYRNQVVPGELHVGSLYQIERAQSPMLPFMRDDTTWGNVGDIVVRQGSGNNYVMLENVSEVLGPVKFYSLGVYCKPNYGDSAAARDLSDETTSCATSSRVVHPKISTRIQNNFSRDLERCWKYLVANAVALGRKHGCQPHDLILVTGVWRLSNGNFERFSTLSDVDLNGPAAFHNLAPSSLAPPDIHLFGPNDNRALKWAWYSPTKRRNSLHDVQTPTALDPAVLTQSGRPPSFYINYVQLEPDDFNDAAI